MPHITVYGIEGVFYEINDEGLRTTPEGYNSDTDNINGRPTGGGGADQC